MERSVGVDEEAESAEPQSGPAGRMEMELPLPSGASGELSRLGAYQALGWMLGGRWLTDRRGPLCTVLREQTWLDVVPAPQELGRGENRLTCSTPNTVR